MQNTVSVSINQNHSSFSEKAFAENHMKSHFVLMLYIFIKMRVLSIHIIKKVIIILYIILYEYFIINVSLVTLTVKCLSVILETRVQSLGREDALEKEMTTHSSTLAWKILWTEEPHRLQSMGLQSDVTE